MLTRKELKTNAKQQLRGRWGTGVLLTFVLFAILVGGEMVVGLFAGVGSVFSKSAGSVVGAILIIALMLFSVVLAVGYEWAFIKIRRKKVVGVGELFRPFRSFGKVLGVYALIILIVLGVYLAGALIAGVLGYFVHWSLAVVAAIGAIVLLYYVVLDFTFVSFVMFDQPELGIKATMKRSSELIRGHKWEAFVLFLSFILWYLLVTVSIGIAALWVGPYVDVTLANYYDELVRLKQEEAAELSA